MTVAEADEFAYRVDARRGYVFVWQRGRALRVEDVEPLQRDVEEALNEGNTRCVMFDNRETLPPPEDVRASMWGWLTEHIRRAAMLQKEVKNMKRAERTGERNRVAIRAFQEEEEGEAWLLAAEGRRAKSSR
ncbi:MAG: hypothetical protein AAGA56_18190 [Myxococcota bacterium]